MGSFITQYNNYDSWRRLLPCSYGVGQHEGERLIGKGDGRGDMVLDDVERLNLHETMIDVRV